MKSTILKFGSIGALIMGALILITFLFHSGEPDFTWGQVIGYTTMIISLSTVFLGIKSYRDVHQAGLISFGKAFQVGILISLFACAVYVIIWMIYMSTDAGTEMMDKYLEYAVENIRNSGASETEIQSQIDELNKGMDMYANPMVRIGMTFLEIFPVGLLITLISAFILKRK